MRVGGTPPHGSVRHDRILTRRRQPAEVRTCLSAGIAALHTADVAREPRHVVRRGKQASDWIKVEGDAADLPALANRIVAAAQVAAKQLPK